MSPTRVTCRFRNMKVRNVQRKGPEDVVPHHPLTRNPQAKNDYGYQKAIDHPLVGELLIFGIH